MDPQDTSGQLLSVLTNQDSDSWWILVGPQDTSVQFLFVLTNQDANP